MWSDFHQTVVTEKRETTQVLPVTGAEHTPDDRPAVSWTAVYIVCSPPGLQAEQSRTAVVTTPVLSDYCHSSKTAQSCDLLTSHLTLV